MEHRFRPKRCNSSSLAETVANTEELLTEILVRVPARPLVRFKCVSKHWLSLISDPRFCRLHTLQNPNPPISAVFPDTYYLQSLCVTNISSFGDGQALTVSCKY
ncbi:hypothetical protein ACLB2K_057797 [Fragaria x ananassa]